MISKPNFSVIGAARSGTSALTVALSKHPDFYISEPKEVHFYAHCGLTADYRGPGDAHMINSKVISDPSQFYAMFEKSESASFKGDGSVSTLFYPDRSIDNIKQYASADFKAIVMLRSPTARAFSSYLYLRGRGHEPVESFSDALALEDQRKNDNFHHMWLYKEGSCYRQKLGPFIDTFGDRVHLLIQEEFESGPEESLRQVLNFLGAEFKDGLMDIGSVNRGGEPKSAVLAKAQDFVRKQPAMLALSKALIPRSMREIIKQKNLSRPDILESDKAALDAFYRDDVAYVEQLLGRAVTAWH